MRFRPRFKLRTLLVLVTLSAIAVEVARRVDYDQWTHSVRRYMLGRKFPTKRDELERWFEYYEETDTYFMYVKVGRKSSYRGYTIMEEGGRPPSTGIVFGGRDAMAMLRKLYSRQQKTP